MVKEQDNRRTFVLEHMTLERSVFDFVDYPLVGVRITLYVDNNTVE